MNFIRKISEKKTDNFVKRQFTRYGKGTYENKALLQITKGSAYSINTSFEFAGEFAYELAESISGKTHVTGGIITTQKDISNEIDFELAGMKQFAGVRTFLIDTDMSKHQIQSLFEKFPSALILLSFSTDKGALKTKVKNPKSAKSGDKETEEEPKADFCSFKTKDEKYVKDLAFDVNKDYKKVFIKHTFEINDLDIPKEYLNDFVKARLHAIRKGKLIRQISIDGDKEIKEYKLEV